MQLHICNPCIEADGHELCFISHARYGRRISCDVFGKLQLIDTWNGRGVWRFTKIEGSGNFIITSWVDGDSVLCSSKEGAVFTASKKKLVKDCREQGLEEWKISLHPETEGVAIQSAKHNRFLSFNDQDLSTVEQSAGASTSTSFHLCEGHCNHFYISSKCHDKVLSSTKDQTLTTNQKRGYLEKWIVEPAVDKIGVFTILSLEHGKFLGSSYGGDLVTVDSKQHWAISSSPHGVFLRSVKNGGWLSCDDEGKPFLANSNNVLWETWCMEPIMPTAMSGRQLWSMLGIGAATATAAIAMPFAVMGVVGAMGFGAGGIASGSMAAGMMSAEAIASGGAVAAGGTVATLQSIGAAGLGVAGASAAAGTGAVVGGLSSLGVVSVTNSLENEHSDITIKIEEPERNMPLCTWRLWNKV